MRKYIKYALLAVTLAFGTACSDFDEINKDPNAAAEDQINVIWMLNHSITEAQMNPHIAERIFVYYWKDAARQQNFGYLTTGGYNDGFNSDYFNQYISNWMKSARHLILLADKQLGQNSIKGEHDIAMTKNVREVARIWYVYLMSEFTDNFGPAPLNAFSGDNPSYNTVEEVYNFMFEELKDASSKLDLEVKPNDDEKKFDRAYGFDFSKWKLYATSMRMRLAMRLSEVKPDKAKAEFEDAVKGAYIADKDAIFRVKERDGWDPLSGVMSRGWNDQSISETLANLYIGLGGVKSSDQLTDPDEVAHIKPEGYLGVRYANHWPNVSNDPYNGFWLDGLPYTIDPRAYVTFTIPYAPDHKYYAKGSERIFKLTDPEGKKGDDGSPIVIATVEPKYTFNGFANGSFGDAGSANELLKQNYRATPVLANKFRTSDNYRVFFGDWESYFLIAEAAVRGWNVPMSAKDAYEKGIRASFVYNDVEQFADAYISSESYNRVGTSVAWNHTAEPPKHIEMDYVDGYTGKSGKWQYVYPDASKTFYGLALNDAMTKIITQKYLAQMPWLPLEAWSDHRRLGLPFFENLIIEKDLPRMPWMTESLLSGKQQRNFFPQRLRYPSSLENANPIGYKQALDALGGPNDVFTPLWWAKKN